MDTKRSVKTDTHNLLPQCENAIWFAHHLSNMQLPCQVVNPMKNSLLRLITSRIRKPLFPTQGRFLLYAALASSLAHADGDNPTARQQITDRVKQQVTTAIAQQAQLHRWPSYKKTLQFALPAQVDSYPPCPTELEVKANTAQATLAHQHFLVYCASNDPWQVAVSLKLALFVPAVFAKNDLQRGQILTRSDIALHESNIATLRGSIISDSNAVIGMSTRRRVRAGDVLTQQKLTSPILVQRGAPVTIVANQQGVEARTRGIALKKGRKGEVIGVKNSSSGREVLAVITRAGEVKVTNGNYF